MRRTAPYLAYSTLLGLSLPVLAPYYLWKGWGTGRYLRSFGARVRGPAAGLNPGREPSAWLHAVSVGEVLALKPLLAPLRERLPGLRLFVSTTTETGQEVARRSLAAVDGVLYAPFDWARPVRAALDRLRPRLLVIVETELWPNLIHEAHRRGVRVALVNGRLSDRSFPRYRRARALLRPVLSELDLLLMQSEAYAERARQIGAPADRVRVSGTMKYDVDPPRTPESLARLVAPDGPLWVAGSTMAGEEEMVLRAYAEARSRVPGLRLLLAPRHPERAGQVAALLEAASLRFSRRSALEGPWSGDVLLLDTLGELAALYPLASVVFVGGSLVPTGGHNVLEPAVAGKAVVVGPYMENFRDVAEAFLREDALVQVPSAEALGPVVGELLQDDSRREGLAARARALVERNRGAVRRTVDALAGLLA